MSERNRNIVWRVIVTIVAALGTVLMTISLSVALRAESFRPPIDRLTVDWGGWQRVYRLQKPVRKSAARVPLIIALHGGGQTPETVIRVTGVVELAARHGIAVAYPAAFGNAWNDGRANHNHRSHRKKIDDVGFLRAVAHDVARRVPIDLNRIYVVGASNGGMMALRLACEAGDMLAAAAVVIANLPAKLEKTCAPSRPVSLLIINGTDDPLVPWRGGQVRFGFWRLGRVLSTEATFDFWARRLGCNGTPLLTLLRDRYPSDGTRVRRYVHRHCTPGSRVVLYRIDGGGHTWPGGNYKPNTWIVGKKSRELDAAAIIWQFLRRHRRL